MWVDWQILIQFPFEGSKKILFLLSVNKLMANSINKHQMDFVGWFDFH